MSKLSVGGMGAVYKAEHALIGKLAAVKVLHPELSTSRDIVNRFFNEAKATTTIKHPGIVEVFDFGYLPSGHAYLVMEFLEGMSLARRCKTRGTMSEGEAAMLLRSVCGALSAAHAKGIVHRDLKPDNIFLIPDAESAIGERPKLLDFGIAKLTDVGAAGTTTKTGAVMGTPTYMSPEQCRGSGEVDHRADLYSIGCIFYELLTGKPPFTVRGAGELIGAHLYVQPDRPSTRLPTISEESEQLLMALLSKDPAHRPQTAKELAQRFATIAQQQGWIMHGTPSGVTASVLPPLTPPLGLPTVADPGVPSAAELSFPSIAISQPEVAEKPTTLSGAASQSVVDVSLPPRRSRLPLAMAAAALVAGTTVAIVMLTGRGAGSRAAASAPAVVPSTPAVPAIAPASPPAPPVATPTEPAAAETDPAPPAPVPEVEPPAARRDALETARARPSPTTKPKPKPTTKPVTRTKPATRPAPAARPAAKPPLLETELGKPPRPPAPKKNTLLETEL